MKNKAYIDCGAHDGNSVLEFLEGKSIFLPRNDSNRYKVWAFEPNAVVYKLAEAFKHRSRIHPVAAAVWTHDGWLQFKNAPEGVSSCVSKYTMQSRDDWAHTLTWHPCIDLAAFLQSLDTTYIVLKLDIESAEYEVLPHLIDTRAIRLVNELYVEFHHLSIPENKILKENICGAIRALSPFTQIYDNWP